MLSPKLFTALLSLTIDDSKYDLNRVWIDQTTEPPVALATNGKAFAAVAVSPTLPGVPVGEGSLLEALTPDSNFPPGWRATGFGTITSTDRCVVVDLEFLQTACHILQAAGAERVTIRIPAESACSPRVHLSGQRSSELIEAIVSIAPIAAEPRIWMPPDSTAPVTAIATDSLDGHGCTPV